ncbi:MAG: hypothetical protein FJ117_07905 [Deltaproteobacteria bacterium]|nr:hypothetical protein [Deltaproteobacteria bacterium]
MLNIIFVNQLSISGFLYYLTEYSDFNKFVYQIIHDGTVTGVHPNHQDVRGFAALITNRTNPPVTVRTELFDVDGKPIVVVQVPKTRSIVFTSEGLLLRHEEQTGTAMPIDSLIILSRLGHERRLTTADLTADIQRSEQATRTAGKRGQPMKQENPLFHGLIPSRRVLDRSLLGRERSKIAWILSREYGIAMAEIVRGLGACTSAIAKAIRKMEGED